MKDVENNNNKSAYETKLNVKQNVDSNNFVDEPDELSQKKEEKKFQDEKENKNIIEINNHNIIEEKLDKISEDIFLKKFIKSNNINKIEDENKINNDITRIEEENNINNDINKIGEGNNVNDDNIEDIYFGQTNK